MRDLLSGFVEQAEKHREKPDNLMAWVDTLLSAGFLEEGKLKPKARRWRG